MGFEERFRQSLGSNLGIGNKIYAMPALEQDSLDILYFTDE
jgi:hypothetical protein